MRTMQLVGVSALMMAAMVQGARAGAAKPAWCTGNEPYVSEDSLDDSDASNALAAVAYLRCNPDKVTNAAHLEKAAKQLSARFAMSDADFGDVADWHEATNGRAFDLEPSNRTLSWTALDPVEQFASVGRNQIDKHSADASYFVDALGPKVSQAALVAYAQQCMHSSNPVIWAMCQADLDALDGAKLGAELHADKTHAGRDRMYIRAAYDDVKSNLAAHAADVKKAVAKDPAYAKMFELAKQARSDWDARWKAGSEPLATDVALEDALVTGSRKASKGCAASTWNALKLAVAKIPAKSFVAHRKEKEYDIEYMRTVREVVSAALMATPDAYLAANAYTMCWDIGDEIKHDDGLGVALVELDEMWPGFRGPRTATQTMILTAGLELDDRGAKIEYPRVDRPWADSRGVASFGGAFGNVVKVSVKGDKAHLTFKQHKVTELVSTGCHDTNHVEAILGNGQVIYSHVCSGAKSVTSEEGPSPTDVIAATAVGLKPGMNVAGIGDYLFLAWAPGSKSEAPVIVLGQPVK